MIDGTLHKELTQQQVAGFLMDCPDRIGMTRITLPQVHQTEQGWAGMVVIAESHIAIHSYGPEVHVDIFSCKPFDPDYATRFAAQRLDITHLHTQQIQRTMLPPREAVL